MSASTPSAPRLVFAFEVRAEVAAPIHVGQLPRGTRRIVPILGGTFEGPTIKGRVLPGADWQIIQRDGFSELDTRYALETSLRSCLQAKAARHSLGEGGHAAPERATAGRPTRAI